MTLSADEIRKEITLRRVRADALTRQARAIDEAAAREERIVAALEEVLTALLEEDSPGPPDTPPEPPSAPLPPEDASAGATPPEPEPTPETPRERPTPSPLVTRLPAGRRPTATLPERRRKRPRRGPQGPNPSGYGDADRR